MRAVLPAVSFPCLSFTWEIALPLDSMRSIAARDWLPPREAIPGDGPTAGSGPGGEGGSLLEERIA